MCKYLAQICFNVCQKFCEHFHKVNFVQLEVALLKHHRDGIDQRGYSLHIEEQTLRTTKVLRQIGCSARHFRRNFASPDPSPDRDKTIESRSIDHLLFFKNRAENFFLLIGQYGYQKTKNFTLIPNPKAKFKQNA